MDPTMTPEERAKLSDVLMKLPSDQLSNLTVILYEDDIYQRLKGSSTERRVASLISYVESRNDVHRLIELLKQRRPDIDLSWHIAAVEDAREHEPPKAEAPLKVRDVLPEFADRMRQRRPGYDEVFRLVQEYDKVSTDELEQMPYSDFVDSFVRPLFEALGWSVKSGGGMSVPTPIPTTISSP